MGHSRILKYLHFSSFLIPIEEDLNKVFLLNTNLGTLTLARVRATMTWFGHGLLSLEK